MTRFFPALSVLYFMLKLFLMILHIKKAVCFYGTGQSVTSSEKTFYAMHGDRIISKINPLKNYGAPKKGDCEYEYGSARSPPAYPG
jgi:hypothetical protein